MARPSRWRKPLARKTSSFRFDRRTGREQPRLVQPPWHYEHEPETRAALDLIAGNHFSRNEPGIFAPILDTLLTNGDHYRHLADLTDYAQRASTLRRVVRRPTGVGAQSDPEHRRFPGSSPATAPLPSTPRRFGTRNRAQLSPGGNGLCPAPNSSTRLRFIGSTMTR